MYGLGAPRCYQYWRALCKLVQLVKAALTKTSNTNLLIIFTLYLSIFTIYSIAGKNRLCQ